MKNKQSFRDQHRTRIVHVEKLRNMEAWISAFNAFIEAEAEAKNNLQMRGDIKENIKVLQDHSKNAKKSWERSQARSALVNQKQINDIMHSFDLEHHKRVKREWAAISVDLIALGWDLAIDVDFETPGIGNDLKDGEIWISQKGNGRIKFKDFQAQIVIFFFQFVAEYSVKFDPLTYTKEMLLKQGINEQNFDAHSAGLAIKNPWKP